VNFLEQLYRWHKQQGNPRVAVPTINHKPLDLWLLRKEVRKLGGYETVQISSYCCILIVSETDIWCNRLTKPRNGLILAEFLDTVAFPDYQPRSRTVTPALSSLTNTFASMCDLRHRCRLHARRTPKAVCILLRPASCLASAQL
jgi:hypothetical protein